MIEKINMKKFNEGWVVEFHSTIKDNGEGSSYTIFFHTLQDVDFLSNRLLEMVCDELENAKWLCPLCGRSGGE